jgi:putative cardiolipin synthase
VKIQYLKTSALFYSILAAGMIGGCASQPVSFPAENSYALLDPGQTPMGLAALQFTDNSEGLSGVFPLYLGLSAFDVRSDLVVGAQASIDIQVFLYHNDRVGNLLGTRLIDAADRGVKVRLLVDDFHSQEVDEGFLSADQHENIEIRLFNPFSHKGSQTVEMVSNFSRLNRRMHNKSFIADNSLAVVGGRNIGDEYFEANSEVVFLDMDLLLIGPVVSQVSNEFDRYWNSSQAIPVAAFKDRFEIQTLDHLREKGRQLVVESGNSRYGQAAGMAAVKSAIEGDLNWKLAHTELMFDQPEPDADTEWEGGMVMAPKLEALGRAAREDVLILTPYFVPQREGVDLLSSIARRGARVRIITNSLASTNQPAVHAGYKHYREALLRAGVELYELVPRSYFENFPATESDIALTLHAKVFAIDGKRLFVGSFNLDPRSAFINTEMGLVVEHEELTQNYIESIEDVLAELTYRVRLDANGELVWEHHSEQGITRYTEEPHTTGWQRFKVDMLGILPIESQL